MRTKSERATDLCTLHQGIATTPSPEASSTSSQSRLIACTVPDFFVDWTTPDSPSSKVHSSGRVNGHERTVRCLLSRKRVKKLVGISLTFNTTAGRLYRFRISPCSKVNPRAVYTLSLCFMGIDL